MENDEGRERVERWRTDMPSSSTDMGGGDFGAHRTVVLGMPAYFLAQ